MSLKNVTKQELQYSYCGKTKYGENQLTMSEEVCIIIYNYKPTHFAYI